MLDHYQVRPQKKLGQSFLKDVNIIRKIVEIVDPGSNQTIVEIGAGLGLLTEKLAEKAEKVVAIEIDPRLEKALRMRFEGKENVEVVGMDVLQYDFSSACRGGKIKVVGNIPYHISTPILFRLLEFRRSISAMTLMFQRELADRIMASPGTKQYGLPSVMVASRAKVDHILNVPPDCFYPVPGVFSSILRFTFRKAEFPFPEPLFDQIVRTSFAQRRKTLWNNIRRTGLPDATATMIFNKSGIDRTRRAETLSVDDFCRLTRAWIESGDVNDPGQIAVQRKGSRVEYLEKA